MSKISAITNFKHIDYSFKAAQNQQIKADSPYYYDPLRAENEENKEAKILPDTLKDKTKIAIHKMANTLSEYPIKGFKGDKNSNFYEFLTMGMFPYVAGGLTFIALFNGITKYFPQKDVEKAQKYGLGMALGVIFYGIAKEISKKFISVPVKLKTGINLEEPYRKVVDLIPDGQVNTYKIEENKDGSRTLKEDNKAIEYHTTFESVDFPRMDLYYQMGKGKNRNEYFDKIAEKNGFGTNLADSDQEVKPFIKEVVVKARTAQTLSQYLWAAVGVGLGVQEPWKNLLKLEYRNTDKTFFGFTKECISTFGESLIESTKNFFRGGSEGAINKNARYAGRALFWLAALTTVCGIINAVRNPYMSKQKSNENQNVFKDKSKVQED